MACTLSYVVTCGTACLAAGVPIDLGIDQGGGQTAACGAVVVGTPYAKSWNRESLGSQALCAHPASTALLQSMHTLRSLCHNAQTEPERQPKAPAVKSARTTRKLLKTLCCSQDITLMCYRSNLQSHRMMRLQLLLRCF